MLSRTWGFLARRVTIIRNHARNLSPAGAQRRSGTQGVRRGVENSPHWGTVSGVRGCTERACPQSRFPPPRASHIMRPPLILTAFIGLISCFGKSSVAHAECLPSAKAVWAAHPGSHATWRLRLPGHEGVKCWFVRGSTNLPASRARHDLDGESRRGTIRRAADQRTKGASAVNGSDERPARSESQDTLPPHQRAPSSILIWGTPMQIDATWEEIFRRREHRTE
jgi:hypothetical protein